MPKTQHKQVALVGSKIVAVRNMTEKEKKREYWDNSERAIVIELDNGCLLYPSRDYEGNGPGALFGYETKNSYSFAM